jgi:hypothetical protein
MVRRNRRPGRQHRRCRNKTRSHAIGRRPRHTNAAYRRRTQRRTMNERPISEASPPTGDPDDFEYALRNLTVGDGPPLELPEPGSVVAVVGPGCVKVNRPHCEEIGPRLSVRIRPWAFSRIRCVGVFLAASAVTAIGCCNSGLRRCPQSYSTLLIATPAPPHWSPWQLAPRGE